MEEFEIYEFESLSGKKFDPVVQDKINYVLSRVLFWYPDKVIESLNKNHRKFAEGTLVKTRRLAGYPNDNKAFFEDFGFIYINKNLVRKEQNLQKQGLKDFITHDERLKSYYDNSLFKNFLFNQQNIFSDEFKNLFNKINEQQGLNYSLDELYNVFIKEEFDAFKKFANKKDNIYYIPCGKGNTKYQKYLEIPRYDGINGFKYHVSDSNEKEIEKIEEDVSGFDPIVAEEIINDFCNSSKHVASLFKGKEQYLYLPEILKASTLNRDENATKAKIWKILDYSCFNQVRVALYFLSLGVEIGGVFPNSVVKKARDYEKKYLNTDKKRLFYDLLNGLDYEESQLFTCSFYKGLGTKVRQNTYSVFSIEKELIDYVYQLFNTEPISNNNHITYQIPVDKSIYFHYYKREYTNERLMLEFKYYDNGNENEYSLNFVMDGIKEEPDRYLMLCHYGILPKDKAKIVLLDKNVNSFDTVLEKAYKEAFPKNELENVINEIFAKYDPESKLDIDNLEGYDDTPFYAKNTLVKVKFDSGGAYDYNAKCDVTLGSRVYVSGKKKGQIGTVVAIYDHECIPSYEKIVKVTNEVIDIRPKFEEVFPTLNNPINIVDKINIFNQVSLKENIEETIEISKDDELPNVEDTIKISKDDELPNVDETIERVEEHSIDEEKYKLAESLYNESNYVKALSIYRELEDYKDSKEKVSLIEIKQAEIAKEEKYKLAESLYNESNYVKALSIYKELEEYKDSKEKISLIKIKQIEIAKEEKYKLAESLYNESDYFQALILYKELEEYKDSKEKVSLIENKQAEIAKEEKYKLAESLYNESNYIKALSIYKELEEYKDSKEKISLIEIKQIEIAKEEKYNKAVALIKNGSYKSALRILKELNGYKESNELTLKCNSYILEDDNYKKALELSDNAKYDEAYELIKDCNNENNIKLSLELKQKLELFEKYNKFNYKKATVVELQNVINELKTIKEYKNVNELISLYSQQISRIEKEKSISKLGLIIGGIASVVTLIIVLIVTIVVPNNKYEDALYKVNNKDYDSAEELLISLNGHKDSEDILLIISALKELDSNLENGVNKLLELNVKVTADYKSSIESNLPSVEFTDKYYSKEHNSNKYNLITWELTDYVVELNSSYSVNLELKGIYDEKEFNISYVLDGGIISNDYPTQYKYGNSLDLPIPYKKGYEFIGWNSDNKTFYINSDNTIKNKSYGDVVLTATYKANEYKVTFDTNGGTMSTGQTTFDSTITYGNVVEVSEPTKIGYKFIGWYYGDVKLNLEAFNIAEDCLIKAKWEIINYKIEYIGDDINIENPSTITYEDVVTLNPVEKTGYSFIGWRYNGETHEKLELINVTNDITLEALFKPNDYTITLDPNGGISNLNVNINYYISGKLYTTQTLKPGEKVELLYLTNGNSIISGWYLDPEYRNKFDERNPVETDINLYGYYSSTEYINPNSYSSGRPYTMTCPIMGSSNTIYIRSKVSGSFTIYYKNASTTTDYNGDKETYISISNRTSGKTYVSKKILKSNEGYSSVTVSCLQGDEISISCWKVKSSGTGWNLNIYFSGCNNNSSDIVAADEINKIDVTYDSKITLPTPTKEGYKFIGWYLNDKLFTDELYVIADNIKLIAKWE